MTTGLLLLTIFAAAFALIARRLSSTILTPPIAFLGFGFLVAQTGLIPADRAQPILHVVAEVALILLLFLDAAQIDLKALRQRHVWPARMLLVGLPLAIALGAVVNWFFFPSWPFVAALLLAAILAPTDAALGQAVVTNPLVPERVRRALTVESGLNDGLALPLVLLFASLSAEVMGQDGTNWVLFGAKQLLLGPAAGVFFGVLGGCALLAAKKRELTAEAFEGVGAIALAGLSYLAATEIGGNGFISAFVAGLAFGHVVKGQCKFVYEFTESEGLLLTWGAFFLLGLALVPEALQHLDGGALAVILISLFVVRPLAIWVSLSGTDASPVTRLFFGWFGPRGLATALFALLVVHKIDHQLAEPVLMLAINSVWISALLHGVTANPGASWYAARVAAMGNCPETEPIENSAKPVRTHEP
ncbi:MAG: cation:proton antiporter [Pseudomonadota bacterium]